MLPLDAIETSKVLMQPGIGSDPSYQLTVRGDIMPKLYDFEFSGSCYKVRLLLNILDVPHEKQNVDFVHKEHKNVIRTWSHD